MKYILRQLLDYSFLLLKHWFLWVVLAMDVLAIIIALIVPSFVVPRQALVGLSLLGLFWASFQVFQHVVAQIPNYPHQPPPRPSLSVELIEGSEYSISLSRDGARQRLPNFRITLHCRIANMGSVRVHTLSIYASTVGSDLPWGDQSSRPLDTEGRLLTMPRWLSPGEPPLCCDLVVDVSPPTAHNDAQFANELAWIGDSPIKVTVQVETQGQATPTITFRAKAEIPVRPIKGAYLEYWKNHNYVDLLNLAEGH